MHSGQLLSIQTGTVRPLRVGERTLMSAIGKTPVEGPVAVGPLGLAGDEQSDLSVHGGLSKAVYALPSEHLSWWQQQRQARGVTLFEETLAPGYLGENLSLQSVLEQEVFIGDVFRFENVTLRVTQPREPCGTKPGNICVERSPFRPYLCAKVKSQLTGEGHYPGLER